MPASRSLTALSAVLALAIAGGAATSSYLVRSGDTLSGIAARTGRTVGELVEANDLVDADRIFIGQHLRLPARATAGATGARMPMRLVSAPERLELVPAFRRWSAANGLPTDLLMAMTWMESGWQNGAVSEVGAVGIGQLLPSTTDFIRDVLIGVGSLDPAVPEHNIRMSARYLRWLLKGTRGEVRTALAGYYQGPHSVWTRGAYPSTVAYVDAVLRLRPGFAGLARG